MRNPLGTLERILEILEDLYGNPRGLLDNAIRDVKWERGSLASKVSSLQRYRTKLRNLFCVAVSIGLEGELSKPKLMFCIVDCFNTVLYAQITNENRELKRWQFDKVLSFLDEQISNLQFKERHAYDT